MTFFKVGEKMANRIKGISVEIGGDTKPLQESLKAVNKTSEELQGELKDVNKAAEVRSEKYRTFSTKAAAIK